MKPHIITLLSILSLLSVRADENVLSRNAEWHRVTFELRRPAGADQVEVAIEVKYPAPGVDVADLVVTWIKTP